MLDVFCLLVVLLSALWGYLRGGLSEFLGMVALVAAYFGSAPLGGTLAFAPARLWDMPPGRAYLVARVAAGVGIYVLLMVFAWIANRKFGRSKEGVTYRWNRALGGVMGLGNALLIVLAVLFIGDALVKVYPEQKGALLAAVRRSHFRRMVSGLNPADRFLMTDSLRFLRVVREDPDIIGELRDKPQVRRILEHPDIQEASRDKELQDAVENRDFARILKNERVRHILVNKELMRKLFSKDMQEAMRSALEGADQQGGGAQK